MSILSDITRPFWLPGLNAVGGIQLKGLGGWICDEEYQIYSPVLDSSFVLSVSDSAPLIKSFAADINRIGSAAFETAYSIGRVANIPKSTGWLVIKTYYSSFFAAHALLRIFGVSCAPLEREHIASITRVADLFGQAPVTPLSGGLYRHVYDAGAGALVATHAKNMASGAHEAFWHIFHEHMGTLSIKVLSATTGIMADRQLVSTKLSELVSNLCFNSSPRGRWLSLVRNAVNYNQRFSTWYPYGDKKQYYDALFSRIGEWRIDPVEIDLTSHEGRDLRRFQSTCNFIVAFLRSAILDISRRSSEQRSFVTFGPLALLNLLEHHA